jgi:hypothetical protein
MVHHNPQNNLSIEADKIGSQQLKEGEESKCCRRLPRSSDTATNAARKDCTYTVRVGEHAGGSGVGERGDVPLHPSVVGS